MRSVSRNRRSFRFVPVPRRTYLIRPSPTSRRSVFGSISKASAVSASVRLVRSVKARAIRSGTFASALMPSPQC
ncbi:hypothetical protein NBEOAGPD_1172 [Methylobacterium gregans]|uniref:Uncharacterized protein n=1 Tax=Methylobacterium gregans TaxID=374424 RepID=A0AA37HM39_9HYPH|nr:hypothetical protein NBEOAGPD_1172 [Methylobacterium gregans]